MRATAALLTAEEERNLALRIRMGDEAARAELVERNIPLAVSRARLFRHRGFEDDDIVQEAFVALTSIAGKFDPDRGARFSTFAVQRIDGHIMDALSRKGDMIRVPSSAQEQARRAGRVEAALRIEHERPASREEIDELAGISTRLMAAVARARGIRSFPIRDDSAWEPAHEAEAPGAIVEDTDWRGKMRTLIANLPARMRSVVGLRFGLDGSEPRPRAEIARMFGVSGTRIGQIEQAALERLRRSLESVA